MKTTTKDTKVKITVEDDYQIKVIDNNNQELVVISITSDLPTAREGLRDSTKYLEVPGVKEVRLYRNTLLKTLRRKG